MQITSFGQYPSIDAELLSATRRDALQTFVQSHNGIARGLGRSYGDSALSPALFSTDNFRYFLDFDEITGTLTCEAGVSFQAIIQALVPRGFFLPVTPGTQFVTIGGAIASDIHGKNHHKHGCFSEFVQSLELLLPSGEVLICSRNENSELFFATCGGMGLTGIILTATLKLLPINSVHIKQTTVKAKNLDALLSLFEQHQNATYSVAWLDCTAKKSQLGRGVLLLGEHCTDGVLTLKRKRSLSVPFNTPAWLLNRTSVSAFNHWYAARAKNGERTVNLIDYFYPLDAIKNWNRLYGKAGFLQYQCVIPMENASTVLKTLLAKIADFGGGSFLSVLKKFGDANQNLLSFPMKGYTLALDFKRTPALFPFLDTLDELVLQNSGRLYLTKDARMSRAMFEKSYPNVDTFQALREKHNMTGKFFSLQSQRLGLDP